MDFQTLAAALQAIAPDPAEKAARNAAHQQWASIAKPLGSLGLLETALEDIAALTCSAEVSVTPRSVLLLCADNGVVRQGAGGQPGPKRLAGRGPSRPGPGAGTPGG